MWSTIFRSTQSHVSFGLLSIIPVMPNLESESRRSQSSGWGRYAKLCIAAPMRSAQLCVVRGAEALQIQCPQIFAETHTLHSFGRFRNIKNGFAPDFSTYWCWVPKVGSAPFPSSSSQTRRGEARYSSFRGRVIASKWKASGYNRECSSRAETQAQLLRFPEQELQRLGDDYETMRSYEETECMPAQAN